MPVTFKVVLVKGPQGEIFVNGNYVSGSDPIYVERVNVVELDAGGNAIGATTYRVHMSIDPSPGSYLMVTQTPSGTNVKGAKAVAYYIVVDKNVTSTILNL
jgi:hypothetical protein